MQRNIVRVQSLDHKEDIEQNSGASRPKYSEEESSFQNSFDSQYTQLSKQTESLKQELVKLSKLSKYMN